MKQPSLLLLALLIAPILGCDDNDEYKTPATTETATTGSTTSTTATATVPPPPTLGEQIERMGRAGITTATQGTFESDKTKKDAAKDAYNATTTANGSQFQSGIEKALGIYDSLDTDCTNQFAADKTNPLKRYSALAGVIADDQIYVNAATGTCTVYLAVEASATGIIPNADCGGRTPTMDVIDTTYSIVSIGKTSGVTDGIDKAGDKTPSNTQFPFLADPN